MSEKPIDTRSSWNPWRRQLFLVLINCARCPDVYRGWSTMTMTRFIYDPRWRSGFNTKCFRKSLIERGCLPRHQVKIGFQTVSRLATFNCHVISTPESHSLRRKLPETESP